MRRYLWIVLSVIPILVLIVSCSKTLVKEEIPPYEQFQKAMNLFQKEDYLKAQGEFQRVIYSYPGLTFIDTAQYYLAMCFFTIESYSEAIGEFRKLLQTYPTSAFADDSQYNLAMSHFKESPRYALDQFETYAAIDEFSAFIDKYPASPLAEDVKQKLDILYEKLAKKLFKSGELYLKMDDYQPALMYFEQVRDNYPNTEWAARALYYTGEAQMKLGKSAEALVTFQNFVLAFPDQKLVPKARKFIAKIQPPETGG